MQKTTPKQQDQKTDRPEKQALAGPHQLRLRRRRWSLIITVVLLVILIAGVIVELLNQSKSATSYQFQPVTQGTISLSAIATGSILGNTYNVDFATSGTISEIDVRLGQLVQAGQLLGRLDPASVSNPGAATLRAPHAGMVTAINGSVGTATSAIGNSLTSNAVGATANSFVQVVDTSSLQAVIDVDEADMGHIAKGDRMTFSVDAYSSRTFEGTVSTVLRSPQVINNVVTYPTVVDLDAASMSGANLLPGMTIHATVTTVSRSHVLLVPISAVSSAQRAITEGLITRQQSIDVLGQAYRLLETYLQQQGSSAWQDDPNAAYVLERIHNQWVARPVLLGLSDGTSYEVLAGLNSGENVLIGVLNSNSASSASTNSQKQPIITSGGNSKGK